MTRNRIFCLAALVVALSVPLALPAAAAPTAVARYNDWTVFTETTDGDTLCYAATTATDKAPKAADHGEVWFYVTNWSSGKARNQPSLKVGYDLREDLPPRARIGRSSYGMFSVGREAFTDDADDPKLVRALERGSSLRVEAVSQRNTRVAYEFSLRGSANAIKKARESCL